MSNNSLRLRRLFEKYVHNTCSPLELQELWTLMGEYSDNDLLDEDMKAWWDKEVRGKDPADQVDGQKLFRQVIEKEKVYRFSYERWKASRSHSWIRWTVAATLALLIGSAGYFLLLRKITAPAEVAGTPTHDVQAPQTNCAIITLGNGQKVYLDNAQNGTLAHQDHVKIVKLGNGKIAYNRLAGKSSGKKIEYNTLTNPRGSQVISMTLADGSQVWLNAGSSITYPVAFTENKREVSLSGEAYFEVVHNSKMPFKVKAGNEIVEDMGTHFNINTYKDEPAMKTTLVEGAVKITLSSGKTRNRKVEKSIFLIPGQQAVVMKNDRDPQHIHVIKHVNVDDVIAWKDGKFRFSSVDMTAVMRQAARWYDVDVVYQGKINGTISGGVSRSGNISQLLHIIELTGKVTFVVEGKKVIVQPVNTK